MFDCLNKALLVISAECYSIIFVYSLKISNINMILKILLVEFATMLGQGRQDLCTPLRFQNSFSKGNKT